MKRTASILLTAAYFLLLAAACRKVVEPTTVKIKDPVRHYRPVIQGQELDIVYPVTNTGTNPLVIYDIQPSCGCIVAERKSRVIVPPERTEYVRLKYNSTKNVGLVAHTIRLYGNILPAGMAVMRFDVNVVPGADYTRDYEELYREYSIRTGLVDEFVNGTDSERGYYVDEPLPEKSNDHDSE